jgi:hypothetical protein
MIYDSRSLHHDEENEAMNDCGGCHGLGSHRRWCPALVGPHASALGQLGEQAEALGDSIGANDHGAANACYHAADILLQEARRIAMGL